MAKKRVHELAKQYDMPSAEVLKRLADAGIEVKAAASAVDEDAADRALTGRPQLARGRGPEGRPRAQSTNGAGAEADATPTARQAAPAPDALLAAGRARPRLRAAASAAS